jgi:hypothetical protein
MYWSSIEQNLAHILINRNERKYVLQIFAFDRFKKLLHHCCEIHGDPFCLFNIYLVELQALFCLRIFLTIVYASKRKL